MIESVLIGGPCHRKKYLLADNTETIRFSVSCNKLLPLSHNSFNSEMEYKPKTAGYKILYNLKYYNGETIYVHDGLDINKSKIIQKLQHRKRLEEYERRQEKYRLRF